MSGTETKQLKIGGTDTPQGRVESPKPVKIFGTVLRQSFLAGKGPSQFGTHVSQIQDVK